MADIIQTPPEREVVVERSGSGAGIVIAVVAVLVILFLIFGTGLLRGGTTGGSSTSVPAPTQGTSTSK